MDSQLQAWLENLALGQYFDTFVANDVELRAVPYLTDEDLRELGLSLGHRRVFLAAATELNVESVPLAQQGDVNSSSSSDPERRQLTVMFCDLVGSTQLSNELDPEELRDLLQLYQNLVTVAVRRFDGFIAKFLGDGVVAYFGWPHAYEDQAERAVRAGLRIISSIQKSNAEIEHRLEARIGIATGDVVVGDLVGDTISDHEAVVGETPNRASRLQNLGNPGDVIIGQRTRSIVGQTFEVESLGPQKLKGFADPVHAWRVLRESDIGSRFEAAHGHELTQRVGREHELGLVRERWQLAAEGDGQVLMLSGEAGIGKSRIVQEFRVALNSESYEYVHLQCLPTRTNSAFFPVIRYLRQEADLHDEDASQTKLDKLERLLADGPDQVSLAAPVFAALLSIKNLGRYGDWARSPQELRSDVIEKFIGLIVKKSQKQPVLCVIEDVHWIDASMNELIGELLVNVIDQPIYVVITSRPEFSPTWPDYAHLSTITLNRLPREQAVKIVESVGGPKLMAAIVDQIVQRSDGVPLFVEELTKSVLERASSDQPEVLDQLIPATLHSSLVARIDQLGSAKDTAQIGAVIGREFKLEALAAVMDRGEASIHADLEKLVESGLVMRRGRRMDGVYSFKHALVHDATYSTILRARRRTNSRPDNRSSRTPVGRQRPGARRYFGASRLLWRDLGQGVRLSCPFRYRAMGRSALKEAAAQFEHALEAAKNLEPTADIQRQIISIKFELRNALWALGRFGDIIVHLDEAKRIAAELKDPSASGWISVFKSASHWQLGRGDSAIEAAEQALEIANDSHDPSLKVAAKFYFGCAHITSAKFDEAEKFFGSIAEELVGERSGEQCGLPFAPAVIARSWMAWSLAERGEFAEAQSQGDAALQIASDLGLPFNLAHIYYDLGCFYETQGRLDEAEDALEKAYGYVKDWSLTYLSPFIMGFLGHVYAISGRTDEGLDLLERAQTAYATIGLGLFRSLVGIQRGEALMLADQLEAARQVATAGVALANDRGERGHHAFGLRVLGDIAARDRQFDPEDARSYYEQSLAAATSLGMRPLQVQCLARLGQLNKRIGEPGNAEAHAAEARALADAMAMKIWPHIQEQD